MSTLISDKLDKVLKENKVTSSEISNVKKYIEALRIYDSLINSGVAKPRGNNLLSRDKVFSSKINFNR
ncbi:hypothetical protein [Aequorivita sp. KMM 9714]|uniref:hypothetical protein n=1 Tax=Aequorivita sp. KMM 9714 TaxID=2707173 RepID=UPI0013EE3187|nr:hypothetical protein [Aequorivita sp. KMM 9714]NGX84723.1 hypothetical protein [Aequorivita sp. KMM 9714]